MRAVAIGMLGAAMIHVFYRGVQHKWPASYFAIGEAIDSIISRGIFRYLLFRLGPLYLVSTLSGVTTERLGGRPGLAIAVVVILHLLETNIWAVGEQTWLSIKRTRARVGLIIFHLTVSALLSLTAVISCLTLERWRPLVPTPDKMSEALWTGIFAAVLAVYVQRLTTANPYIGEIISSVKNEVGEPLMKIAKDQARHADCDPLFLQALMLAEAHQRPGWFRRIERIKSKVVKSGTYGIMQVKSDHPLTDEESIEIAARSFAGFYPDRTEYGSARHVLVAAAALRHNPDRQYSSDVATIYSLLDSTPAAKSLIPSYDKRASIEVTEVEAIGAAFHITGSAAVAGGVIEFLYRDYNGQAITGVAKSESIDQHLRGTWTAEVPVDSRILVAVSSAGHDLLKKIEQGGEISDDDLGPLKGDLVTVKLTDY